MSKRLHWFDSRDPRIRLVRLRGPACACRGITLIELLMVIVIMMIVMGLSGAAFTGMTRGTSERAAISQITSALALSRQYAITHRENVFFAFGVDTNANQAAFIVHNDRYMKLNESLLPVGQWFDLAGSTPSPIKFKSDGTLDSGFFYIDLYVTNSATPGVKTQIQITRLTGMVRVL